MEASRHVKIATTKSIKLILHLRHDGLPDLAKIQSQLILSTHHMRITMVYKIFLTLTKFIFIIFLLSWWN